jgi:ubiquinone/menaquinone biosynthesis C-methylase UbiE
MSGTRGSYDLAAVSASAEAARLDAQASSIWTREQAALHGAGLTTDLAILDLGCGGGGMLGQLVAHFRPKLAVGVDLNREFLIRARTVAPVARTDGARLSFRDSVFDFVLLRLVLRHVPSRMDVIQEAIRVVRPGGIVCAIDVDEGGTAFDPEPSRWPALKEALATSARRRGGDPFVGRTLPRLFAEAGLVSPTTVILPVTTADLPTGTFIDVMLAPTARAIDPDLLAPHEAALAWEQLRKSTGHPNSFGYVLGILTAGRKPQ